MKKHEDYIILPKMNTNGHCRIISSDYVLVVVIAFQVFFSIMWLIYWIRKNSKIRKRCGKLSWLEHQKALLNHTDGCAIRVYEAANGKPIDYKA
jgi:hypothetical protein